MKLYHGTKSSLSETIAEQGLQSRGKSGAENKWKGKLESRPDAIYLTNVYSPYFAAQACDDPDDRWLIVEVDTLLMEGLMCPDEDYLEQIQRAGGLTPHGATMEQMTQFFRENVHRYALAWEDSLGGLGTCSVISDIGITPDAITGIYLFDQTSADPHIVVQCLDPTITLMNYRLMGETKYRELTAKVLEQSKEIMGVES